MDRAFRISFAVLACSLTLGAAALIWFTVTGAFGAEGADPGKRVLDVLGSLVIAIAVFDFAKYLFEEEVLGGRDRRFVSEARRTLTRFVSTIVVAICLEGIMLAFKVVREDYTQMLFPVLLLLCGIAMLIGLGIYQRLSAATEQRVARSDKISQETTPQEMDGGRKSQNPVV